jgi:hypothetical protein
MILAVETVNVEETSGKYCADEITLGILEARESAEESKTLESGEGSKARVSAEE